MGIFTTVLLVFAGVALLVGSFVIWNTFNVLVAQRRREVALLRAVGATRRQVLSGVLLEAASIGLVSGALGLLTGVGLAVGIRSLLKLVGVEIPTTSPAIETRTVLVALAVGLVVTMVAALAAGLVRHPRLADGSPARRRPASGAARAGSAHTAGWLVTGVGARDAPGLLRGRQPALVDRLATLHDLRGPGLRRPVTGPRTGHGWPTTDGAVAAGGWPPATSAATHGVRPQPPSR